MEKTRETTRKISGKRTRNMIRKKTINMDHMAKKVKIITKPNIPVPSIMMRILNNDDSSILYIHDGSRQIFVTSDIKD